MKMARAIPVLSGGAAAVLVMMAATPALASPGRACDSRSSGHTSITSILQAGNTVTGVRGSGGDGVVLTGLVPGSSSSEAFLFRGRLARAAGAAVSVLHPAFRQVTSATFYGPNTHLFNPRAIPRGQIRAVGSYISSAAPQGVHNQGMIYLGPLSGRGGSWTSIDVPAYGRHVTGHVRACPRSRRGCHVLDTIPHSTMGNLVVGNYNLNPTVRGGLVSGNAFIYNMTKRRWTLLRMHGSLSTKTTLYGIWQDGGPQSPRYTLAGGSSARGGQRGFLINYNERTGAFGLAFLHLQQQARHIHPLRGDHRRPGRVQPRGHGPRPFPGAGVHPGAGQVLRPGPLASGQRRRERTVPVQRCHREHRVAQPHHGTVHPEQFPGTAHLPRHRPGPVRGAGLSR